MKNKKDKFRRQFRKTNDKKNKKHPAYIYAKVGDNYEFLGITHAKITKGLENIPLEKNPNPKDTRPAFVRTKADISHKSTFGARLENWKLSDNDKKEVEKIIIKNKERQKK